jgi:hypothetical protein
MITKAQRNRLEEAIRRHVKAQVEHSWRGGKDPNDVPAIDEEARDAKRRLNKVLDGLTESEPKPDPYLEGIMKREGQR